MEGRGCRSPDACSAKSCLRAVSLVDCQTQGEVEEVLSLEPCLLRPTGGRSEVPRGHCQRGQPPLACSAKSGVRAVSLSLIDAKAGRSSGGALSGTVSSAAYRRQKRRTSWPVPSGASHVSK